MIISEIWNKFTKFIFEIFEIKKLNKPYIILG